MLSLNGREEEDRRREGGGGGRGWGKEGWVGEKASKAAYQQVAAALRLSSPTPPACRVVDSLLILTGVLSRRSGEIKNCQHVNKRGIIDEVKLVHLPQTVHRFNTIS